MVNRILDAKISVHSRDSKGVTPLHVAVAHKHLEIVELLLDKGADVNSVDNDKVLSIVGM